MPVPQPGTRQKRQARAGRRGAELAAQSEKGQVNRSVSLGQATLDHRSKLGGGSDRGTGCGEINKAVHKRAGGHPHPATRPARALPQRPRVPPAAAPGRAGLPGPPAAGPAPRACKAWEVPGRPRPPGCSAVRSPRSSPRPATSSSAGRAAPARTARLPAAAAVALPAHRRGPRPRSAPTDRPPAQAQFAPTWPACPPSPGHCAHVRGRGHNPARIPRPGRERTSSLPLSERASERASGTHPPHPQPRAAQPARPQPQRRACTGLRAPACHARARAPHAPSMPGIHTPGRP